MNSPLRIDSEPEHLAHADAVLQRYFADEVPVHWPPAPAVKPLPRRQFSLRRRHLALAASFLVAVGCWWFCGLGSGAVPENSPPIPRDSGRAEKKDPKPPRSPGGGPGTTTPKPRP